MRKRKNIACETEDNAMQKRSISKRKHSPSDSGVPKDDKLIKYMKLKSANKLSPRKYRRHAENSTNVRPTCSKTRNCKTNKHETTSVEEFYSDLSIFNMTSSDNEDDSIESLFTFSTKKTANVSVTSLTTSEQNSDNEEINILSRKTAEYKCWDVTDGQVILLEKQSKLYVHGCIELTVLKGNLDILGYECKEGCTTTVYSPRGSSHLCINVLQRKIKNPSIEESVPSEKLLQLGLKKKSIAEIISQVECNDALFLCKKVNSKLISFLEKHLSEKIFPQHNYKFNFIEEIHNEYVFEENQNWNILLEFINKDSKVFICGGKGVGKSTLLRYFVNKLISSYKQILVIDLDPGQSEFTIAGCISAVLVDEPLLGPNYTHLKKPAASIYVPNIKISNSVDIYFKCVKELLKVCPEFQNIPTFINYMGYTKELGIELVSEVIAKVSPTIVVQVKSKYKNNNFSELLSPERVREKLQDFDSKTEIINYKLFQIQSQSEKQKGWKYPPAKVREMCVLGYLSQMLNKSLSLTDVRIPIHYVDMSKITLKAPGKEIDHLAVANANIVALCSLRCISGADSIYNCYGWGIVRAIDTEKNILYLITPLTREELKPVTHIIVGSVSLPPSIYMTQDSTNGLVPYVALGVLSEFARIPKRSYRAKN